VQISKLHIFSKKVSIQEILSRGNKKTINPKSKPITTSTSSTINVNLVNNLSTLKPNIDIVTPINLNNENVPLNHKQQISTLINGQQNSPISTSITNKTNKTLPIDNNLNNVN